MISSFCQTLVEFIYLAFITLNNSVRAKSSRLNGVVSEGRGGGGSERLPLLLLKIELGKKCPDCVYLSLLKIEF